MASLASERLNLLRRPIVSEKTTVLAEDNQYVFEVVAGSNKVELAKAFELAFPGRKVTKVRLMKMPPTTRRVGRHTGYLRSGAKAIFTIEGDPIELFAGG